MFLVLKDRLGLRAKVDPDSPFSERKTSISGPDYRHDPPAENVDRLLVKNGGPVANQSENSSEHDLKKRHVIVENLPILNKASRPRRDYVHVLRLVGSELVTRHVHKFQSDMPKYLTARSGSGSPLNPHVTC